MCPPYDILVRQHLKVGWNLHTDAVILLPHFRSCYGDPILQHTPSNFDTIIRTQNSSLNAKGPVETEKNCLPRHRIRFSRYELSLGDTTGHISILLRAVINENNLVYLVWCLPHITTPVLNVFLKKIMIAHLWFENILWRVCFCWNNGTFDWNPYVPVT